MNSARLAARILVVEDEGEVRNLISLALKHGGYSAEFAEDPADALARLQQCPTRYSAIVTNLPSEGGTSEFLETLRQNHHIIPVIGLIASGDNTETHHAYGTEIIEKPVNGEKMRAALQHCFANPKRQNGMGSDGFGGDIGEPSSVWKTEMQSLIRHVAAADVPVLIQGETGAGKEVLARQLHGLSVRAKKPVLKVNCAALPSELIESELFGYERGAFTGAFKTTHGKFEMADGGSILLDEIGDMDFRLQAKLLQVLQDCEFIRLGSSEPRRVDVRVLAATHCDLEQAIVEKRFREDLYYRLNIITIRVPPLRDRSAEIIPLAYHFIHKHSTPTMPAVEITPVLRDALLSHDWPGNIRELENVIRKLLVIRRPDMVANEIRNRARRHTPPSCPSVARVASPITEVPEVIPAPIPDKQSVMSRAAAAGAGNTLQMPAPAYRMNSNLHEDLPAGRDYRLGSTPEDEADNWSILDRVEQARREAEAEAIIQALSSTLWNRKRAAELLNIDYKALLYKMKKLGIAERAKIAI
jgi:two-component system, NtrC family, response regulator AtoC